jgi:manganese transport protein
MLHFRVEAYTGMSETSLRPDLTTRTDIAIAQVLAGQRRGLRALLPFAGPAFVASVAYVDPGNFATNIQAGAHYGYGLLWVVLLANAVAMLFQAMSAKLGIVTGRNLAELCRAHFPRRMVLAMWLVSEVAAMATDLAEFLGGAIGLALLFGLPLLAAMAITAVATYAILMLDRRGYRPLELTITGMVGVISLAYLVELLIAPPDWLAAARGSVIPSLPDAGAVTLAVGIVGATVMPHAIYLHSGLTQGRGGVQTEAGRRGLIRFSNIEVVIALTLAGLVNLAMVMMAAAAFHEGHPEVAEIETAYHTLIPLFGAAAGGVFLVALIASGLSSSAVGTMAGQVIMQGFTRMRIPVWARRAATMLPAFVVVALGANATESLVYSQVVLSLALPVPMVALVVLSARRDVMGGFVNARWLTAGAGLATVVVLGLNVLLLLQIAGVGIPGLG